MEKSFGVCFVEDGVGQSPESDFFSTKGQNGSSNQI